MEFLDTVLGAAVVVVGYALGQVRERKRRPSPPRSICGCGHHRSFHVGGTGECKHQSHHTGYNLEGAWGAVNTSCTCQHYTGPKTLDDLIPED